MLHFPIQSQITSADSSANDSARLPGLVACTFWIPGWRPTTRPVGRRKRVEKPRLRCLLRKIPVFLGFWKSGFSNILLGFLVGLLDFFVSIFKVWGFKEWLCFFLKEMFVLKKFSSKLWNPEMLTTNHDLLIDC